MIPSMSRDAAPLIAVSACLKTVGGHPTHTVGEKYLTAVSIGAGGTPMIVPALGAELDIGAILGEDARNTSERETDHSERREHAG